MSLRRSRSSSSEINYDSVKRDQRSSSIADEDRSEVKAISKSKSRSNSPAPSKSKTKSKSRSRTRSRNSRNSGDRKRSNSRGRRSGGHRRSRSGGRARYKSRSRSRSPRRNENDDGYRLHIAGWFQYLFTFITFHQLNLPRTLQLMIFKNIQSKTSLLKFLFLDIQLLTNWTNMGSSGLLDTGSKY